MKIKLFLALCMGFLASTLNSLIGGLDMPFTTLFIFMIADYVTGCICALVFKKSPKTKDGAVSSNQYIKGLFKKLGIIIYVIISTRLDIMLNINYVRTAVIISFVIGETISIIENLGLMGLPMPDIIKKSLTLLNKKAGTNV